MIQQEQTDRKDLFDDKTTQVSFVEFFCEPGGNSLMNGFAGEIGTRWMVFDKSQKWVFHKIASK